jgi:DNA-binding CsgD family transcriptional regulator
VSTATRPLPEHGTLHRRRIHRCTCQPCILIGRRYDNYRNLHIARGNWDGLVDAEPLRQHIKMLSANGMGWQRVATISGVSPGTLRFLLFRIAGKPPRPTCRAATLRKILAVQPRLEQLAPGARIPATGTHRRIQALAATGWNQWEIGQRLGLNPGSMTHLLKQTHVAASTALAARDLYDQLRDADPSDHGIESWIAERTRRQAIKHGWNDPIYWDDMGTIDDPDFDPDAAETPLNRNELAALRKADVEHLAAYGIDEDEIAERVGLAKSTVHALVEEWRTGTKRDRRKQAVSA